MHQPRATQFFTDQMYTQMSDLHNVHNVFDIYNDNTNYAQIFGEI